MFKVDDQVTIRRGKHKGPATILHARADGTVAVVTESGALFVTNADNLKAPDEIVVPVKALAAAISSVAADEADSPAVLNALGKLAGRLNVPGLGEAISWPLAEG